jgi:two-component system chemotaxis response regulator CheB
VIRLLVVDDSALMRKLLEDIFLKEGDFDVRLARNGSEALELVHSFDPQVVTLDVQMPGMDGLSCLSRIMVESPRPVVMISALTDEGAEATLEAMDLGAIDFVAKPSGTVSLEIDRLKPLLIDKVRGASRARIRKTLRLSERIRHRLHGAAPAPPARRPRPPKRALKLRESADTEHGLVMIGSSTGGPAALDAILPRLPAQFPWPIVVAQHMPASFTGPFSRRLDRQCALQVVEVAHPMPLQRGVIYIARGDADMVITRRSQGVSAMPVPAHPDYPWHPSVERMVSTAMEHYDPHHLVGVLLTGMGYDGSDAMTSLRALGGRTIAEAESTAAVWGMPGELVKKGGAERVAAVDDVAAAILDMVEANAIR